MAPVAIELAALRALSFRISSTPTLQLPHHVPAIAASLVRCRTLFSSTQPSASNNTSLEASVAVHKYRTLLSSLLQHRTVQGRWSAIVLIKATIEVGGWEALQKCLPWVRGLLGILTKPDPPSSKKLCIITLTRIFLLTRDYPTLVREITTPSLPPFIQASMNMANSRAPQSLLQVILESFNQLLPRHPTIFRSYLKQLQSLLSSLVAPTPSSKISQEQNLRTNFIPTSEVSAIARQLYVQLPSCAPKGTSSQDWTRALKSTINNAHNAADKIFRAVVEDWQSTSREMPPVNSHSLDDEVHDLEEDSLGLPPWSGIFAGGERLKSLLTLVREYLTSPTANSVHVNMGAIMDLVTRMVSLTPPASNSKDFQNTVRFNNQVSREERENLWLLLPEVHLTALDLLLAVIERLGACTMALDAVIADQLVWLFGSEKDIAQIRAACYVIMTKLLGRSGAAFPKPTIDALIPLIRACCEDLLPPDTSSASAKQNLQHAKMNGSIQTQSAANVESYHNFSNNVQNLTACNVGQKKAAFDLLTTLLANVRAHYLSDSMRARLDRTAILIQHKEAMTASVLNPPPSKKFGKPAASIVPLLARSFPAAPDVETMLRPRMPVIRLNSQDIEGAAESESLEEDAEEEVSTGYHEDLNINIGGGSSIEEGANPRLEPETQVGPEAQEVTVTNDAELLTSSVALGRSAPKLQNHHPLAATLPQPTETSKRTLSDRSPDPSSKRVKTHEQEQNSATHSVSTTAVSTTIGETAATASEPEVSDFTASTTASAIPELPVPVPISVEPGIDADESDDDIGELVLGPDTDEESE